MVSQSAKSVVKRFIWLPKNLQFVDNNKLNRANIIHKIVSQTSYTDYDGDLHLHLEIYPTTLDVKLAPKKYTEEFLTKKI